jgi:uncharacterized protein
MNADSSLVGEDNRRYGLLPFRFRRINDIQYILVNEAGQFITLEFDQLRRLIDFDFDTSSSEYLDLLGRHFIYEDHPALAIELLSAITRTRNAHLPEQAGLHIFVVTLRCTNQCKYCQVTQRERSDRTSDMSRDTADLAIDFMFQTPSKLLKVEYQGGEAVLNFDLVRYITETCEQRAQGTDRVVEFVLCTNLVEFTEEHAQYCRDHRIAISTSLDGPKSIHDDHRCNTHESVLEGISTAREFVGPDRVSALMTPTATSLKRVKDIVDEYLRRGFRSIFLRPLNPYGGAAGPNELGFSIEEWVDFYRTGLDYIIGLNRSGIEFREEYTAILLRRILRTTSPGFVDLQNPTGAGLAVLTYHFDGSVYLSDESRMLAEMGDDRFKLVDLRETTSFPDAITDGDYVDLLKDSMLEASPMCSDCAYAVYCGSDPIGHYREQGDIIGHKAFSDHCRRHLAVFDHLFKLLESDDRHILYRWIADER